MSRGDRARLAGLAAVFLAWHVPLMFRTEAGQDEHWFGVAGITVLRSGLPQIPYIPSRDPAEICYRSDVALYVLPPLSFYLQGLVHLAFGRGLGQARLASALEGLVAACLVYRLGLLWFGDRRGSILAATTYLFSRPFSFSATTARPDMAATMFGLLAVWWAARYRREPRRGFLVASGAAAGLALLSHPFGVVPATQVGLLLLASPGPPQRRAGDAALLAGVALAVFGLWIPLIALHPEVFGIQFFGNVVNRAGPGLGATLLSPLATLAYQARQIAGHLGPIQSGLYLAGVAWGLGRARRSEGGREFLYHLVASVLLLVVIEGRHPTLGYYAFPVAFTSLAVGMLARDAAGWLERIGAARARRFRTLPVALVTSALLAALLPGSGLRALAVHARHGRDPAYDAHALAHAVMADVPPGRLAAVDCPFVLDFYLAGRPVVAATVYPVFYDVRREPFEYAVLGRMGLERTKSQLGPLELIGTYGDRDDPFAPYAELYRRR
jgi:4-amino-4-deoxy-L-arabinose transferase-like glycosyltransferase